MMEDERLRAGGGVIWTILSCTSARVSIQARYAWVLRRGRNGERRVGEGCGGRAWWFSSASRGIDLWLKLKLELVLVLVFGFFRMLCSSYVWLV